MTDTFPRQFARTQRLTLGEPRTITTSPDGTRVAFLRSSHGSDPVNALWVLDVPTGTERLVADPRTLLAGADEADLPPAERARRERAREGAGGITSYACDAEVRVAAFTLGGRLSVAGLLSGRARELPVTGPVFDPRPDPAATRLAYVSGGTLRIGELDGTSRVLCGGPDGGDTVSWGSAEFVAAEEMGRSRGFWWSPDGTALAVARVDVAPVSVWWIGDPARPATTPTAHRYPAAGTANADVTLHVVTLAGERTEIVWDRAAHPYLARVSWSTGGLLLSVQSRDQRELLVLRADPATGATEAVAEDRDDAWVELVAGTPTLLDDGRLVLCADRGGARRLLVGGLAVTPASLQVRSVVAASGRSVLFHANDLVSPAEQHVWRWSDDGGADRLTVEAGVHTATGGGPTVVIRSATLGAPRARTALFGGPELTSYAELPLVRPNVTLLRVGVRSLATALVLPSGPIEAPLPVLVDPYGGPHSQRVVATSAAYCSPQWFADQGFAVVVVDGRGTPGRGSDWERAVHRDLAGPVLEDQADALAELTARDARLDATRVAIRGWSFGGYLAALAVLRRPDVFHAAIAGAPVTEWRLYDTHYTERYLGDPRADPGPYDATSLLADAHRLTRPLLLVHGLADDNVVAAHTLQFSSALLAAGRAHQVLPLSGVTHMTPQEVVAENLLLLQLEFLRTALARPS